MVYFKGANAILQNTISTKIGIIEHWLATILKILMKPLILAKILFAKIHLCSNDYATYYSWLPDKSNPGMLRMLTKEQLEQKNISSELVCRIRFTLVCIILLLASTSCNFGQRWSKSFARHKIFLLISLLTPWRHRLHLAWNNFELIIFISSATNETENIKAMEETIKINKT